MPILTSIADRIGPLQEPDENGLRLPEGFTSQVVASSGQKPVPSSSDHKWHNAPDGGATFETPDKGWIYVSNSEMSAPDGGVSALRFDAQGVPTDCYPILTGSNRNCAGGPTPWGTWLSCEEVSRGKIWECDPSGTEEPQSRPALGRFRHEAVAVDPSTNYLYMTEDERNGRFYRFIPGSLIPGGRPDLTQGTLQVAQVMSGTEGPIVWRNVPDADGSPKPTRKQITASTRFKGGEGIWHHEGVVYFSTKGDNRVWAYDAENEFVRIIYDDDFFDDAQLTGVDNVTVARTGDVLVAEDGGDMQIMIITPARTVIPLLQIHGHSNSEVTGPAFDPSGTRLYFSSQRGRKNRSNDGMTYEVSGPFLPQGQAAA